MFSVSHLKDFQNVLRLQRLITVGHSIGFQLNLADEQTTLSPTGCSQNVYDLCLSFLHNLAFLKNGILQIIQQGLGCKSGELGFGYLIKQKLASYVLFQSMA